MSNPHREYRGMVYTAGTMAVGADKYASSTVFRADVDKIASYLQDEIERLEEELGLSWKKEGELEDLEKRQFKVIMYLHDTLEKIASVTICNVSKNIALKASETADEMLLP